MNETILSVLPGASPQQRVTVVHRLVAGGGSELVLRKESWSEKVGWFDQGSIELSTDQVRDLRAALGSEPRRRPRQMVKQGPMVKQDPLVLKFPA